MTRTPLANAASVASTLMTTECLIVEAPESGDAGADDHGEDF